MSIVVPAASGPAVPLCRSASASLVWPHGHTHRGTAHGGFFSAWCAVSIGALPQTPNLIHLLPVSRPSLHYNIDALRLSTYVVLGGFPPNPALAMGRAGLAVAWGVRRVRRPVRRPASGVSGVRCFVFFFSLFALFILLCFSFFCAKMV